MRVHTGTITSSPTDLANFLSCRHKTELDLLAARGMLARPMWVDPLAEVLRDRGLEHERTYIDSLRADGLRIVDLTRSDDERVSNEVAAATTIAAMRSGADVIVQAPIFGDGWFGYADVLRRVEGDSAFGAWHYEVHDTKLTRETRGGTILQLCVYSHVVGEIQQRLPEFLRVVTPVANEPYRVDDFAAFYRQLVSEYRRFLDARRSSDGTTTEYPQPNDHCEVCRWWESCNKRRRLDDHLSFVAGLGRSHQEEFESRQLGTLAALASVPLPLAFKPRRGSRETCEKLREQARVQQQQRDEQRPVHELLAADSDDFGLRLLPAPSAGDLFIDFEGDPFAREGGREYLIGVGRVNRGEFVYESRWAFTDDEERALFEWLMDQMRSAVAGDPQAHIYHYAPYEPAAVKRLMSRYATREVEVDELLRGDRFVDLYAVVRRSLRAGVESYSIKKMEPFYSFIRDVELERAGDQRRVVELALETGDVKDVTPEVRAAVEGYNRDDCRSTLDLRIWLEALRSGVVDAGVEVPRPGETAAEAPQPVKDRDRATAELRERLLARIPDGVKTDDDRAIWLMAYLIDWHRREDKVVWWEYFRLKDLPEEELDDEPAAVARLEFVGRVRDVIGSKTGRPTGSVIDRYRFPPQEFEIRAGMDLKCQDDSTFGEVVAVDRDLRTIDVKKGRKMVDVHPTAAFTHDHVNADVLADALLRIGGVVAEGGIETEGAFLAGRRLLMRSAPRVGDSDLASARLDRADQGDLAVDVVTTLDHSVLPVQGPPGTGKTFTGARMICELVRRGRKVGVTATSHKVIRNLLDAVAREAAEQNVVVRLGHKRNADDEAEVPSGPDLYVDNASPLAALSANDVDVVGGTAWLWARPEYLSSVDVLFVDEAGQMSLANVLAVSQAASSLVLLGDPQQLEQPQRGSHPDGVGVSALEHVLGGHKTMPDERGIFLPVTWRLTPAICTFTSEVFYEGKLHARAECATQRISGDSRFGGSGLRVIEVSHDHCRNASNDEVDVVSQIVDELLSGTVEWTNDAGESRPITARDILVVAPYNAQVARLAERLADRGVSAGTVDRFQGQEAPVVIYSMATSKPEDAPRGMEFLYNPNRLNVATSRAKCLCILVASPHLFEPECHTPRQMQLANALCRYREMAHESTNAKSPSVLNTLVGPFSDT